MLRILLMSLNAKFIHTNLAIRSIESYYNLHGNGELFVKEYTINNQTDDILMSIEEGEYDAVFASAYVWNIEPIKLLFSNLKTIKPKTLIFLGGPEVSFNPEEQMRLMPQIDGILVGEGEQLFIEVVEALNAGGILEDVDGLYLRNKVGKTSRRQLLSMDDLPFPYENLKTFENRILYYESARGCPYNCSYCLSAATKGVRYKSLNAVYKDLNIFLDANVPQVKFVDRTFNVNKAHALSIMKFIVANDNQTTNFHFEINADLLDEDYFDVINSSRKGLFQFEIGIQTTYEKTMKAINRPIAFERLKENTVKLIGTHKAHIHVDLIAGLPYESFSRFLESFDDVYAIGADQLQLGFLKLLKGTPLHFEREIHGYTVRTEPPFEVLSNYYITYKELSDLKRMETLVEYYHNSGKFTRSLKYALAISRRSPSQFFMKMKEFWQTSGYYEGPVGSYRLFEIFHEFTQTLDIHPEIIKDLLKFDYYFANLKGQKDLFIYDEDSTFNTKRLNLLNDVNFVKEYLPHYLGETGKAILKHVLFSSFRYSVQDELPVQMPTIILFSYENPDETLSQVIDYNQYWSCL